MGSRSWTDRLTWERGWGQDIKPSRHNAQEELDYNGMIADGRLQEVHLEEYPNGDIYDKQPPPCEQEFEILDTSKMPYLAHIKSLQIAWPHLRHLKQWMEVTTAPEKWQLLKMYKTEKRNEIRQERARRTNIAALDFVPGMPAPKEQRIKSRDSLGNHLDTPVPEGATRLYVVEDLSRDVVELLGSKLDIDPLFFREHINDYTWNNIRDPWVDLPDLDIVSRTRPYFCLTYLQPRYFETLESCKKAQRQAGLFNVLRRLDVDHAHRSLFDKEGAAVALVRSKMSLWVREARSGQPAITVLLIDPSITEGHPLWKGYRPFVNSPTPSDRTRFEEPPKAGLFEDLLFWIRQTPQADLDAIRDNSRAVAYRALQILCAEWLTLSRYITARLSQIEWEIERSDFRIRVDKDDESTVNFNASLQKLHTWRRRLPLYRDMVSDTRMKLFHHLDHHYPDEAAWRRRAGSVAVPAAEREFEDADAGADCVGAMRRDFSIVAGHISDLLSRTERIAAVGTAVTAIEESRRAIEQNKALGRLTYLAVIFAPLSFVSSFFSMSENVGQLTQTIWIYFCVAVPISLLAFLLVDKNWTDNMKGAYRKGAAAKKKVRHHEKKQH
ncbi:hypothetical protein GGR52DRAFT_110525 [Hypoxylon sp. FL1284]|nr:hypothetical protein GGR52DRAFT_110525 [Hypoxylon sp. FL1284]